MSDATPAGQKVRAIDVRPYQWAIWCTVADHFGPDGKLKPFANEIEGRKWSDDGQSIWFMLGTHNFYNAKPDDVLELVPIEPKSPKVTDEEQADFVRSRPVPMIKCPTCGGGGKVVAP
jgi:hypothetical protein